MALDRLIPTSATVGAVTGDDFMDAVQEEIGGLWDRSTILLTGIGGTANAITATATPAVTSGLQGGMRFAFVATGTNAAGGVTIAIGAESAIDLLDAAGDAPDAGAIASGSLYEFVIDPSIRGRLVGTGTGATGAQIDRQVFTVSGTWTKPTGFPATSLVIIEMWGAGGGGGTATGHGGGGGGGYTRVTTKLSDLTGTVSVTVGAGGAATLAGGSSNFGGLWFAYGGGGSAGGVGAGGGGQLTAGVSSTISNTGGEGGRPHGGPMAQSGNPDGNAGGGGSAGVFSGRGGDGIYGGGGGGGAPGAGGMSLYGGGGGSGGTHGTGGLSVFGGAGGAYSGGPQPGVAPGGGGAGAGGGAAGARGEVRVTVIG